MTKRILANSLILLVGALAGAALMRAMNHYSGHDHHAEPADAGTWTCSMHPQVQAVEPGKCPICAMDLVPIGSLKKDGATNGRDYSMSPAARALAQIETSEVRRELPEKQVRLFGKLAYDETRMRSISARFPGRIDRLYVDYTGIRVTAGDHLALIYSPELLSAQTELLTALKFRGGDGAATAGARDKLRLWGLSDERIRSIEKSGKASDRLDIDAPLGGIVTSKHVREGDYVNTGTPLFQIADLSHVWVMLDAYESDVPWLRFGQSVTFAVEGVPGRSFAGKISFIDPQVDPQTRTVKIRVNADNDGGLLKPGMFVKAVVTANVARGGRVMAPELAGKWISPMHPEIVRDQPGECDICGMPLVQAEELGYALPGESTELPLVVPASAVLVTGKRAVVYVEKAAAEEPTYEGREIELGPRAGDIYLVESGLREGERVVTQGAFKIDSALQILAAPSMMSEDARRGSPPQLAPHWQLGDADFKRIVDGYLVVQNALADDHLADAQQAIEKLIDEVPGDSIPESITALDGGKDIKELRQKFAGWSAELIAQFTDHDRSLPGDLLRAHCPMALSGENKGADWLQRGSDLRNPYMGARMLRCGTVVAPAKSHSHE